ncbi:hypothetical protein FB45DRAFT_1054072 [Roridomyces roridus]|uniref:F-box domain-containing protein n=1 Tax=Roridomyces roridus TaxID=1738132 RepID=A0AAD7C9T6_9AGAR|nr:hypothetical protein FB45DRAFT_1054072 [Roridomyces roridus]
MLWHVLKYFLQPMSVEALEAEISAVSEDIERQKAVLKQLERDKSLLQRQLNNMRDPITRLPLEISSEVFRQCMLFYRDHPTGIRHIPLILLQICRAWTDIALSTTALWTELYIALPCSRGFPAVLEGWFQRARDRPLDLRVSINFKGFDPEGAFDHGVTAVIQRHSERLKGLEIDLKDFANPLHIPFEITETTPLSSLRDLAISGRGSTECDWYPLLQLLRRSPNLVELNIHNLILDRTTLNEAEMLSLPHLRRFGLGVRSSGTETDEEILGCIAAPNLQVLGLFGLPTLSEGLLPFLERSSPPLKRLSFDCLQLVGPIEVLGTILDVVPTLSELVIVCPTEELIMLLSDVLTRSHPSRALPNLHTLDLQFSPVRNLTEASWNVLLPGLLARRTEIGTVRVLVHSRDTDSVTLDQFAPSSIVPALKELAAGGMDFWIGPDEQNLFSP